jgi:hypothetical protein
LRAYQDRFGYCPDSWQDIIEAGITVDGRVMTGVLLDFAGNQYKIDKETCSVVAAKKIEENR